MESVDMCEHDWPGSGCKKCRPKTSVHLEKKPHLYKDPADGMWVCGVPIYDRFEEGMPEPTHEENCRYYAYGEGHTAKEAYEGWLANRYVFMNDYTWD